MKNFTIELSKRAIKNVSVFAVVCMSLFALQACGNEQKTTAKAKEATSESVKKVLPKLLDLGAEKCLPCIKLAPILVELEKEYKGVMDVEFIDVWQPENKEAAVKHKIQTIPTQIYFDEQGKEIWRHVGFISKEDLLAKWKELGYEFKPTEVVKSVKKATAYKAVPKGKCCGN